MTDRQRIKKLKRKLARTDYSTTANLAIIILTAVFFFPGLILVLPLVAIQTLSVSMKISSLENQIDRLEAV